MCVASLSARHVENSRRNRQPQQLDESACFVAIAVGCKKRPVLQEIVGVER